MDKMMSGDIIEDLEMRLKTRKEYNGQGCADVSGARDHLLDSRKCPRSTP